MSGSKLDKTITNLNSAELSQLEDQDYYKVKNFPVRDGTYAIRHLRISKSAWRICDQGMDATG